MSRWSRKTPEEKQRTLDKIKREKLTQSNPKKRFREK